MKTVNKNQIKNFVLVLFILTNSLSVLSQTIDKVPKFKSFEVGYRHISSTSFDLKTEGLTFLFDYAWQLSGFNGKPAAFISVPLGYTYLFGGDGTHSGGILSYGWTVRHDLRANRRTIPFFGYALLLNQLRLNNVEGSSFGHQTRFDFGYMFKADKKLNPYLKVEYSFTRYPHLGIKESDKIHAFEIKGGIRF